MANIKNPEEFVIVRRRDILSIAERVAVHKGIVVKENDNLLQALFRKYGKVAKK